MGTYKSLIAKGHISFKVTWVKGHATDKHVEDGVTTAADKAGHCKADEIADMRTDICGTNIIQLANYFQERHKRYTNLAKEVARHIVEAYMIHRALIDKQEVRDAKGRTSDDCKVCYSELSYPSADKV